MNWNKNSFVLIKFQGSLLDLLMSLTFPQDLLDFLRLQLLYKQELTYLELGSGLHLTHYTVHLILGTDDLKQTKILQ